MYGVTSTERWVKSAGIDDQLAFQRYTAMTMIGTDIELALLRGSVASGASGTARRLAGVLNYVTTNATAVASGTKLTESFFGGLSEMAYGTGGRPDEVYVGFRLKRIIASFTAGSTKTVAQADKRLTNVVDVYEDVSRCVSMVYNVIKVVLNKLGHMLETPESYEYAIAA